MPRSAARPRRACSPPRPRSPGAAGRAGSARTPGDSTKAARCEASWTLSVNTSVFFSAAAMSGAAEQLPQRRRGQRGHPRTEEADAVRSPARRALLVLRRLGVRSDEDGNVGAGRPVGAGNEVGGLRVDPHARPGSPRAASPGAKIHARPRTGRWRSCSSTAGRIGVVRAAGRGDDAPPGAPAVPAVHRRQRQCLVLDGGPVVPAERGCAAHRRSSRLTSRTHSCTSTPSSGCASSRARDSSARYSASAWRPADRRSVGGRPARLHLPARSINDTGCAARCSRRRVNGCARSHSPNTCDRGQPRSRRANSRMPSGS